MAASGGQAAAADELYAAEGVVDGDAESFAAQVVGEGAGEVRAAGRAVAVAEDEITGYALAADDSDVSFGESAGDGHGVAVDMPDLSEAVEGLIDQGAQRVMIRFIACAYAVHDFFGLQGAVVDWRAGADQAADEADAGIGAGCRVDRAVERIGPRRAEEVFVDVVGGAVRVDVAAGEVCGEKGCTVVGGV